MKKRISVPALLLAMALSAFAPATAAAAELGSADPNLVAPTTNCPAGTNRGGAAALALLVAAAVQGNVGSVCVLNNSLNNLLQNADIHVLENILNNSPILNDLTITVTDVQVLSNGINVTLLGVTAPIFVPIP